MKTIKVSRKIILNFIIIVSVLVGIVNFQEKEISAATDYSSQVKITDWNMLNAAGNPASTTNSITQNSRWQFHVKWELSPSGATLQSGDTFTINLPTNSAFGTWNAGDSAYEDLKNIDGIVMGQWRISAGQIEVVFNDNINNKPSVLGELFTGKSTMSAGYNSKVTQIQNVTFGNVTKQMNFIGMNITALGNEAKGAGSPTNNTVKWSINLGHDGIRELTTKAWGSKYTIQRDVYIEDKLLGDGKFKSISVVSWINFPVNLTTGAASNRSISYSVTTKFTNITQNSGESYADFKARLQPFQYGVYTDSNGVETVVVYFGDIGDNGLKYSDINPSFANDVASEAINRGFYTEANRSVLVDYFNTTYGVSNVIGGNVVNFQTVIATEYDKVTSDTAKTNTAIVTKNGTSKNLSATGTLQGYTGSVTVLAATNAGLFLSDEDTNASLPNATFKLQYLDSGTWTDYTAAGTMTTDVNGFLETPSLGNGTYRFVEVSPSTNEYDLASSDGYDAGVGSVISSEFAIDASAAEGPEVSVTNVKYKYDVIYTKGNHGTFADDEHLAVVINSNTPVFAGTTTGETGYHFSNWSPAVSSTVTKDVTYVAQWAPDVYEITYVLNNGTNDSSNPTTYTYGVGVNSFENPIREGYTFLGWQDEEGNSITNISATTIGDKELTANWQVNEYEITYVLNGGTNNSSNPTTYTNGIGVASFKNPTREGYTFLGWKDAAGNSITNISATASGDKELIANWKKNEVTSPSDSSNSSNPSNSSDSSSSSDSSNLPKGGSEILMIAGMLVSIGLGTLFMKNRKMRY